MDACLATVELAALITCIALGLEVHALGGGVTADHRRAGGLAHVAAAARAAATYVEVFTGVGVDPHARLGVHALLAAAVGVGRRRGEMLAGSDLQAAIGGAVLTACILQRASDIDLHRGTTELADHRRAVLLCATFFLV